MGVRTKRGPISISEIFVSLREGFLVGFELSSGSPSVVVLSDFETAVSETWKHRIQILLSATVKPMT